MLFKQKNIETKDKLDFNYEPKSVSKAKKSIEEMNIMQAMYKDYIVTKTGYLAGIIEISGINLELLNNFEQSDVFDTYNSFLMSTLGDNIDEQQQYLDMTIPVDFNEYLLSYKKRYLDEINKEEPNYARANLIASYIDDLTQKQQNQDMSTKKHLLVVRERINNKTLTSLDKTVQDLNETIQQYISRLEDSFDNYELQAKKLSGKEVSKVLKNLINFTGH